MEIVANIVVIVISLSHQFVAFVHSYNDDLLTRIAMHSKSKAVAEKGKKGGARLKQRMSARNGVSTGTTRTSGAQSRVCAGSDRYSH